MIVACRATGLYRQIVLMVIVYLGLFETEPCGAAKIRGVVVLFRGDALRAPILADLIVSQNGFTRLLFHVGEPAKAVPVE